MIAQSAGADYGNILEAMKRNYPRAPASRALASRLVRAFSRIQCSSRRSRATSSP